MDDKLVERLKNCATQAAPCLTCDMTDDGSCIETLMKQAAAAIEKLQQIAGHYEETAKDYFKDVCYYLERMPKWIPVTERLPKYGTPVLAYGSRGGIFVAKYERARAEWDRDYWWKLNSSIHVCNPTHWMPLPQPPKKEEGE